jgi:hypothetical protein
MTPEQKQKLDTLIEDLAADLKPEVNKVENGFATTQHNYGKYGALISAVSGGKSDTAKIIAAALIKAGANPIGVQNGLNVMVLGLPAVMG